MRLSSENVARTAFVHNLRFLGGKCGQEILQLLVRGHSTKEAATQLNISYIRAIYEKLQVNSRGSAVAKALKEGLV